MKNYFSLMGLVLMSALLSACHQDIGLGNHDNDYFRDDQSASALVVPANLHMDTQAINSTPLPSFNQEAAQVSIYPPDILNVNAPKAELQQPKALPKPAASGARSAPLVRPTQILIVHRDYKRSWVMVGTALKRSGYRILDQDPSSHCFYVLDVRGKGRALNQASPVYCVAVVTKASKMTQVSVKHDEKPAPANIAEQILNNIAAKLS